MGVSGRDIVKRIKEKLPDGISVKTMAKNIGVPWQTIYGWDVQNSNPKGKDLLPVADYLNVSIRWLLTGLDEQGLNYDEIDLIGLYRKFPENTKSYIKKHINLIMAHFPPE